MARSAAQAPAPAPGWQAPAATGDGPIGTGQVLWLMLAVAVAMLPHLRSAPGWVTLSLAAAGTWRFAATARAWPLPGTTVRGLLTVLAALTVAFVFRRISGLDAGSALLILMMALKLLETRTARDRSIVVQIAWFVLFTGFLREQSLASVPQLAAGIVAGTVALLQSSRTSAPLRPGASLLIAGRLLGQALPLALVLFLLFPRLPGPFWALPTAGGTGRTGLSDQMAPGDITSLAQSNEVAFRVRFKTPAPARAELYWRGPVLESFDGRRWRTRANAERDQAEAADFPVGSKTYDYEITLEPHRQRWLLALETPVEWDAPGSHLSADLELLGERPVQQRMAYRARSRLAGAFSTGSEPAAVALSVAAERNPRTRALAAELRSTTVSDRDYLVRLLRMFRDQAFYYTLEPPALGEDPIDDFLFNTRAGFCEHYASAFAILARAGGLPARVVTGYQGGELNPIGDYWIVRQSDAHAWTEVWLDERWERFDPTAAVAPERIELGMAAALPASVSAALPLFGQSEFVGRLALSWDATNAAWDRWVLAFGPETQTALMHGLGFQTPSLRDVALVCAGTIAAVLLLFTLLGLRQSGRVRDPVEESWQRLCGRLTRAVRPKLPAEGPAEYARAVADACPELAPEVIRLARLYLQLRYEGRASSVQIARFRTRVARFRVPRAAARG